MEFKIRKFNSRDIFKACTIITKCGVTEFRKAFIIAPSLAKQGVEAVGGAVLADLAAIVISNLPKCEKEIYEFLSSVSGLSKEEVAELSPADFARLIGAVTKSEDIADFFTAVKELIGSGRKKN
ncbi:hypothetical protein [Porcipelethomonas sp.]|uniref:hypothetical protein n=1 Tax=Porcipelethomonas sp. TaxID=2981675 RepID=UPI003EF9D490